MAHFAKLNADGVVIEVLSVSNDVATSEEVGINFLKNLYGQNTVWKQTSYNTINNSYYERVDTETPTLADDQSLAFRGNYAGIGYTYDEGNDVFIPPKPYESWVLNETIWDWEAPVPIPEDVEDKRYDWDETNQEWFVSN